MSCDPPPGAEGGSSTAGESAAANGSVAAKSEPKKVVQQSGLPPRRYRLVVLGDGGVGKSALTLQYVQHNFIEYHDPTIEDAYQQRTAIDGEPCLLDILDTAGQVEFTAMREQYMRGGEGFIVCYSIADRHSFLEAEEYRQLILKVRAADNVPVILVGNKADLEHNGLRKVTTEEGQALANKLGCKFIETSAAERRHVDEVFQILVREIRRQQESPDTSYPKDTSSVCEGSRWKALWSSILKRTRKRRRKNND